MSRQKILIGVCIILFLILHTLICFTDIYAKGNRQDDPSYQVWHNKTRGYTPTQHYLQEEIDHVSDNISLSSTGRIISGSKILTDGSAVGIVDIEVATGEIVGGQVIATIKCTDNTNYQAYCIFRLFTAINKAGTITSNSVDTSGSTIRSSGTLYVTQTITNGTGKITININANTDLTPTSLLVEYTVILNGNQVVTKL
jgi:hypothetical protein